MGLLDPPARGNTSLRQWPVARKPESTSAGAAANVAAPCPPATIGRHGFGGADLPTLCEAGYRALEAATTDDLPGLRPIVEATNTPIRFAAITCDPRRSSNRFAWCELGCGTWLPCGTVDREISHVENFDRSAVRRARTITLRSGRTRQ
ncbi:MAG: hypothetical protein JNK99_04275 [Candidatus Accumulibacter sp.]|uniref:hypothetical protein n=1 Tax=Accumulibacter sp. TaxID=2053492 RepID=UPI001A624466|nr:hypothetical protein [Accumulibacter sp.]MBL8393956.1 hypothetical protein [Accumulibacter sp.]